MKLHLSKGLRAALIACSCGVFAVASQAVADGLPATNGNGDLWVTNGNYTLTTADQGKSILIDSAYDSPTFTVNNASESELTTVGIRVGEWWGNASSKTFTKAGDGTLELLGTATIIGDGVYANNNTATVVKNAKVNEGTLKVSYGGSTGFVTGDVTVAAGATLQLAASDALGYERGATDSITLKGSAEKVATLQVDSHQTMTTAIKLEGNTRVTGASGDLQSWTVDSTAAGITASGTNNEISTTLKVRSDMSLTVTGEDDVLTVSGLISTWVNPNNSSDIAAGKVFKEGDGTLKLVGNNGVANTDATIDLYVMDGTLDLSEVTTLNAESLNLSAASTLVMSNGALALTGSLTVQSGAIIDLSAWNTNVYEFNDELLFTGVTELIFTDAEGNVLEGAQYGYVRIDFGDGTGLWDNWLYDAGNGNVRAIPEPATATLSLLALAGLAARRRRK